MNASNRRYGGWWIRMAVVYLVVGVALGNWMGATHDFALRSVHAHVNLLGWASMIGFGLVVLRYADTLGPRLVAVQFWIHQLGLPVMLGALAALIGGRAQAEPLVGLASAAVGGAVLLFALNVWRAVGRAAAAPA